MTTPVVLAESKDTEKAAGKQVLCLAVIPAGGFDNSQECVQFPLYWIIGEVVAQATKQSRAVLEELLTDSLQEKLLVSNPDGRIDWTKSWAGEKFRFWAERQFLPGVTDNLAKTIEEALRTAGLGNDIKVASGQGLLFRDSSTLSDQGAVVSHCRYKYFHPLTDRFVVHDLSSEKADNLLVFPKVELAKPKPVDVVALDLDDRGLEALSKERILALNLDEMKEIRSYFEADAQKTKRHAKGLPEWPTDVELEIIAQTWSEHCKHKIFNATIQHKDLSDPKNNRTIDSLYKTYIKAPTYTLMKSRQDLLSVFEDNAGVVSWNDKWAVCFKVETHNSPSALEPYGGALTGILGVNRDILGTGLGAKPIFNTDVFCFAYPSAKLPMRPTMLPPEAIIKGVRKGVEDGGNKSGIPTVNGAIYFHPGYRAKPLVFCGTGGILPLSVCGKDGYVKHTHKGDAVVMVGGRVGKDGIHGATFSSEALHEGSPVSAVQIGDPFTQKRVLDFILEARDLGLITGITDNGAGGLSSSVGEMAQITGGATIDLDHIPLKYPGLADWEIVVSEAQERMTLSTRRFADLKKLAQKHNVEVSNIGTFHDEGAFEVKRGGKIVALLDLEFLHGGAPKLRLESEWSPPALTNSIAAEPKDLGSELLKLLSCPNISSREAVIRQYDHEVQGLSVVKPLMGPKQQAPCDAAVMHVLYGDESALVVSNGLCPQLSQFDTHLMAMCAVDEAVRNAVCVGADPDTLAILDNFCWTDPIASERNSEGKYKLAQLVRACQGLCEASLAYGAPLISGKDSMKNDFDDGTIRLSIPPTLLISAIGKIARGQDAISMEFKSAGDHIYLLSAGTPGLAGSQYADLNDWLADSLPSLDLKLAMTVYRQMHACIRNGLVRSCHDLSEGGLAVALAECVIGSGLGADVAIDPGASGRIDSALFAEGPARLLVSVDPKHKDEWENIWKGLVDISSPGLGHPAPTATCVRLGAVTAGAQLQIANRNGATIFTLDEGKLCQSWKTPLPID